MPSPLISVIVPVYNKEQYVAKLISCVQEQSFRDYECIVIDDGSTDKSGAICDEVTAGDKRFSVVHIPNGGVSHARNTALEIAKGEYITFLDADDEIPADYLKRIAEDIRLYKTDMVIGGIKKVYDDKEEIVKYPFEERVYTMQELLPQFAQAQQDCGVFGWCVNKTFKRELAASCRFDESLTLAEDFDFFLNLYPMICNVYFDCTNYYSYLLERGGFSASKVDQIDFLSQAIIQIRFKKFLEKSGFWKDKNEPIVSKRIQDYLFFAVFHSPKECFDSCFDQAYDLFILSGVLITEKKAFKKKVIKCIDENKRIKCKSIISWHKRISRLIGRI